MENIRDLSFGKMCREPSRPIKEKTSGQSSKRSAQSKGNFLFLDLRNGQKPERSWEMDSPLRGVHSMHSIGESPRDAAGSTLSQILLQDVPEKYYLSRKACLGILHRAAARGKELPELLKTALIQQAERSA